MKLNEVSKSYHTQEQKQIYAVIADHNHIRNIKNPSEAVQIAAVSRSEQALNILINGPSKLVPSEAVQLAAVTHMGSAIRFIIAGGINPSPAVQLAAVNKSSLAIRYITNPSPELVKISLTNQHFIDQENWYITTVKQLFNNNSILMNKWRRYGELMRNDNV